MCSLLDGQNSDAISNIFVFGTFEIDYCLKSVTYSNFFIAYFTLSIQAYGTLTFRLAVVSSFW